MESTVRQMSSMWKGMVDNCAKWKSKSPTSIECKNAATTLRNGAVMRDENQARIQIEQSVTDKMIELFNAVNPK